MTTTNDPRAHGPAAAAPARRKPTRLELGFLVLFHAVISGTFVIAYFSGDEKTYPMHQFAGYAALVALGVRLIAAWIVPVGSPVRLPHPSWTATRSWFARLWRGEADARRVRSPLYAWMAVVMLVAALGIAATGGVADWVHAAEDLHHDLAEIAPLFFFGHLALAFWLHWLKARQPAPTLDAATQNPGSR